MNYQISYTDPNSHFIQIQWTISKIHQDELHLQLPSWRPGRYELQNYAKNIRSFSIQTSEGLPVSYQKTSKDRWEVKTKSLKEIIVSYEYYANQLDAGASYLCADFLYINPVNCLMYVEGRMDEACQLHFTLPEHFTIATQMELIGTHACVAKNFDYLADSPLIASGHLEHHSFSVDQCNFHFWFQGKHPFDIERLERDTISYAHSQIELFGDIPCKYYHFLYLMLDKPFRHGVEHLDSTVIAMGQLPDNTIEEYYHDLLAISCHELFHLWNIKRIRPVEMLPYDFTKENYSTLGYVYEGVTTYYGDLMLIRSGVWSWEQYVTSFCSDLKRHFENEGRLHYSVAESSWDTWLDGYVPGIPGRKVSIYMEGLIAAFLADMIILKSSEGKFRLDDVLKELYQHDFKQNVGYTEERYKSLLEKYSGVSFTAYFEQIIWGKGNMETWLRETCTQIGLDLQITDKHQDLRIALTSLKDTSDKQLQLREQWLNAFRI